MARVLLMTSPEKGHLNPMAGVAQWLRRDGHHVGWLCLPEPAEQLRRLDVEIVALNGDGHAPPPAFVTGGEALARLVRDEAALRAWIRALLLDGVRGQVEPVRAALRSFEPDVVSLDGMLYPGVVASHLEGIPYAGVSSALTLLEPPELDYELIRTVRGLAQDRAALFREYGLEPSFRTCECLSPLLNTIFATEALVGADARVPPMTWLVGPSIPLGRRGDEPDSDAAALAGSKPLVYVSFGSQISWQPEIFGLVAEAAAPLGVRLVLSAGELARTGFAASLPGDVVALEYAPQRALLDRAAAFVTHGGANSVMESIWAGVPLLVLPMCNDQPVQAHFVTRAGAGRALDPRTLSVAAAREALASLLDADAAFARGARRLQASYRRQDGAREAARRVAELAS